MGTHDPYYVPKPSHWPIVGSIGLTTTLVGAASWLHSDWYGPYVFTMGLSILVFMMFGWFGQVIYENQKGVYNLQVDRSFRWAMCWFIFSEVCFFGAFFGALFFSRFWSVPILSGEIHPITHYTLWPDFKASWPLLVNPNNQIFVGATEAMGAWGLAAMNTLILLSSGATITWAHWALKLNKRRQLVVGLALTIALGISFLFLQAHEYHDAYTKMNLTLDAGIYGTTFFMLTGFHGLHVTIGTIMLIVILVRSFYGHFTPERHFGFEAVAWYWHFVDVVWLFLFIFVYWL
ncbi:MAG: MFS transporter [Legionellales bacterium RIFCSPHIGHO2_12_FULL_42_9]|nr:MAG: MFS transporter [Legionellales bacterium RIFCSPHIGHO2_12_FULL_42_9]